MDPTPKTIPLCASDRQGLIPISASLPPARPQAHLGMGVSRNNVRPTSIRPRLVTELFMPTLTLRSPTTGLQPLRRLGTNVEALKGFRRRVQ